MLPSRRSLLAALAVAVGVSAACTSNVGGSGLHLGAAVPGTPVPQVLQTHDCTDRLLAAGVKAPKGLDGTLRIGCGKLAVPLDYSHPGGRAIELTVVQVHTTRNTSARSRSLLFNPGGPGGSGINTGLGLYGQLPAAVAEAYDFVAFDPRGVGLSDPVHCLTDAQLDRLDALSPDLSTPAGVGQVELQSKQYAARCQKRVGAELPFVNTVSTARDMDQIRQAVGDDTMNYLGYSYGTELGWTYAHLFPKQVRRLVLDGAVDPTEIDKQLSTTQVQGFENAFDQFAAHCRNTPSACAGLTDARHTVSALFAATLRTPVPTHSGRKLTQSLAQTGVIEALYSKREWPTLAQGILAAVHGDGTGLLALADKYSQRSPDGSYTNISDANTVISCNDTARRPAVPETRILATARRLDQRFPLFGSSAAGGLIGCQYWQPDRTPVPPPAAATPDPVLVVGNLHDPATPYRGAAHLTAALGNARLLTWNGQGHTSYLSGSACVDGAVDAYLVSGTLPPDRTVCPP